MQVLIEILTIIFIKRGFIMESAIELFVTESSAENYDFNSVAW